MKANRKAYQFFHLNAGCIVGQRAKCAIALARAEAYAEAMDWQYTWEYDQHASYDEGAEMLCLTLSDADGEVLECLGGIDAVFESNARRVFEAEMADAAIGNLPSATFGIGKAA